MGFLTTFTIYNDGTHLIKKNKEEVIEAIYDAMCSREGKDYPIGNHCNLIKSQEPKHADSHTCYVHMGNTVCEMNPWSKETKDILENHESFFNSLLDYLEFTVKHLKKMKIKKHGKI